MSARRIFYPFGVGSGLASSPTTRSSHATHITNEALVTDLTCNMIAYIPIFTQFFVALLGHFPGLHFSLELM